VLALAEAFVAELGSTPVRGRVALDDVLDRDLGIGSLERVELLARLEDAVTDDRFLGSREAEPIQLA
jgi:acyl carrier protein